MTDLEFGVWVTVVGMGLVFGLLALLYGLLAVSTRADRRWSQHGSVASAAPRGVGTAGATSAVAVRVHGGPSDVTSGGVGGPGGPPHDPELVAAVTIAVLEHVEARRLQAAPAMRSYWPGSLLFASRWVAAGRMRQGMPWRSGRR